MTRSSGHFRYRRLAHVRPLTTSFECVAITSLWLDDGFATNPNVKTGDQMNYRSIILWISLHECLKFIYIYILFVHKYLYTLLKFICKHNCNLKISSFPHTMVVFEPMECVECRYKYNILKLTTLTHISFQSIKQQLNKSNISNFLYYLVFTKHSNVPMNKANNLLKTSQGQYSNLSKRKRFEGKRQRRAKEKYEWNRQGNWEKSRRKLMHNWREKKSF